MTVNRSEAASSSDRLGKGEGQDSRASSAILLKKEIRTIILVSCGISVFLASLVLLLYWAAEAPPPPSLDLEAGLVILGVYGASFFLSLLVASLLILSIRVPSQLSKEEAGSSEGNRPDEGTAGSDSPVQHETTRIMGNVAHDIRSSMTPIKGMTELILNTDLSSDQREYFETIMASTDSLMAVVDDVLDYARVEAGKVHFESKPFSLREHLNSMFHSFSFLAADKNLKFVTQIARDVPDALVGDPDRLRQVVMNIVGNAIKFTRKGQIACRVEKESSSDGEVTLLFHVADSGIGIPPGVQERIFEAFYQAFEGRKRQYKGSGLGLAISSELVKLMGGRIWVESSKGNGSTFSFTTRFRQQEEKGKPAAREIDSRLVG